MIVSASLFIYVSDNIEDTYIPASPTHAVLQTLTLRCNQSPSSPYLAYHLLTKPININKIVPQMPASQTSLKCSLYIFYSLSQTRVASILAYPSMQGLIQVYRIPSHNWPVVIEFAPGVHHLLRTVASQLAIVSIHRGPGTYGQAFQRLYIDVFAAVLLIRPLRR